MKKENIKTVEIRDRGTIIPAFAIRMLPIMNAGYGIMNPCILLVPIEAPWCSARCSDELRPEAGRSMIQAHKWIEKHFDEIQNGDVVDVEFILGEKEKPSLNSFIEEAMEASKHFDDDNDGA